MQKIKVTVWSEGLPPSEEHAVRAYPNDINSAVGDFLSEESGLQAILGK